MNGEVRAGAIPPAAIWTHFCHTRAETETVIAGEDSRRLDESGLMGL